MDNSSAGIWEEGNFWPNNYIHMYVYFAKSSDTTDGRRKYLKAFGFNIALVL